jgi:AcrR family transcriptional regulator
MSKIPQPIKKDRRKKIVETAIACFIKNGISDTRLSEIASLAKIDQPLINYYFPTLDSLYTEIVKVLLEDLANFSTKGFESNSADPIKIMTEYIRGPFEWSQTRKGYFSLWMYFYHLASYSESFTQLNTLIRENGRNRISMIIYKGLEKGVFRLPSDLTVNEMAILIQGIISGNTILAGTEGGLKWNQVTELSIKTILNLLSTKPKK